ncbi:glycosyltransferase [Vagococcus lutrae]|uniref:glycosyltransferase n=1 Tax=Vagococcus lutrae TaxID=81947 RepID=UPI0028924B76|nr:glycosyltransferase [Vagococcus lutrae]MDT2823843.1 glycosyltransferase [Vagococcus lutrae]
MKECNFLIGTLSGGGAERVVSNLSLNFDPSIKKNIILFGDYSITYPYEGNLEVLDKNDITKKKIITKISTLFKRMKSLKKVKEKKTTISFLEYPNLMNCLTNNNNNKTIVSVRNHMTTKHKQGLKSIFWKQTIKHLYPKTDLIVACSKEIKKDLVINYKIPDDKIKVIYNSYDLREINLLKKEEIEKQYENIFEYPVIISSGRLSKQKGFEYLIRSFYYALQKSPNLKLVILGEGPEEKKLKNLVNTLGIKSSVFFLGFQVNPFKYIYHSKIYVQTSIFEGFPNALCEAMACGIPVISTDCLSGPREILAPTEFEASTLNYDINIDRNGILIPNFESEVKDIEQLEKECATKMLELLSDCKVYNCFREKSEKRVKDFDIKKLISEWESLIV